MVIVLINCILTNNDYIMYSKNIAYLTFLTTFSSGVLSSLFIRNGFKLNENDDSIIMLGILFFFILSIVPIELSVLFHLFSNLNRFIIYLYVFLNIIFAISIADMQVKQNFYYAVVLDILKTLFPFGIFFYFKIQDFHEINLNIIISILTLANIFGVYYFLKNIKLSFNKIKEVEIYIKQKFSSDLIFGISLISFNSLTQYITGKDRDIISQTIITNNSVVAYTADLITKILNAFLFPFNTKISSELGAMFNENKKNQMYNNINVYSFSVLLLGIILTSLLYFLHFYFNFLYFLKKVDGHSIIIYGLSNTFLMSLIIYQKFYDYGNYKLLPPFLLMSSFFIVITTSRLSLHTNNILFMTVTIYGFLLLFAKFIIFKTKKNESLDN